MSLFKNYLFIVLMSCGLLYAQDSTISVLIMVLDEKTQEPLPNFDIVIQEEKFFSTDEDGVLEITVQDNTPLKVSPKDSLLIFQQELIVLNQEAFQQFQLFVRSQAEVSIDTAQADLVVVAEREKLHQRKQVSLQVLKQDEMKEVAASQGDPLRVVKTLPGVSSRSDLNVRPFVRGGDERETRVFWNNIPLIQPFHALSAYSIFNLETIDNLRFYSGGFPVEGNGSLSGALFMESKPAPTDSVEAVVQASLMRGNAYLGVPILEDKLGVYVSYQALLYDWTLKRTQDIVALIANDESLDKEVETYQKYVDLPNFKDLEFGMNYQLSSHTSMQYTGLYAQDIWRVLSPVEITNFNNPEQILNEIDTLVFVDVGNWIHGLEFQTNINSKWTMNNTFAYQNQDWDMNFVDEEGNPVFDLERNSLNFRSHHVYQYSSEHLFSFGAALDRKRQTYDVSIPRIAYEMIIQGRNDLVQTLGYFDPQGTTITSTNYLSSLTSIAEQVYMDYQGSRTQYFGGIYFADEYLYDENHKLTLGARLEYENTTQEAFVAPRISWFKKIDFKNELTLSSGLYAQNEYDFYFQHFNPNLGSEKAWHFNAEWSHDFNENYRLEWNQYGKYYYDLASARLKTLDRLDTELLWDAISYLTPVDLQSERDSLLNQLGYTKAQVDSAIEFYAEEIVSAFPKEQENSVREAISLRRLDYINTGIGYAIGSELTFKYDPTKSWRGWLSAEISTSKRRDRPGASWYNFSEHRPWAVKWHNYFDMTNDWQFAVRTSMTAGRAYTGFNIPNNSDTLIVIEEQNNRRYSPYTRVDLRLSQSSTFWGHPALSYFEIWNAFNEPNIFQTDSETGEIKMVDFNYPIPIFFVGYEVRW